MLIHKSIHVRGFTYCRHNIFWTGRKCVKIFFNKVLLSYYHYSTITIFYHIRTKEGTKYSTVSNCKTGQKYEWKAKQKYRRTKRSKLWYFLFSRLDLSFYPWWLLCFRTHPLDEKRQRRFQKCQCLSAPCFHFSAVTLKVM